MNQYICPPTIVIFEADIGHSGGSPATVTAQIDEANELCEITEVQGELCDDKNILPYLSGAQVGVLETIAYRELRKQCRLDNEISQMADAYDY